MSFDPVTSIVDLVKTGINKVFPDADAKQKVALTEFLAELNGRVSVLKTELSGNYIQRSWRPITMLTFVAIIANNYILFPYIELFFPGNAVMLELPPDMWDVLKIGLGGYVVGRSVEKSVKNWKG